MASSTGERLSSSEFKKRKELEEARKAGTVAPEVDEDGKEINPHIPQYIAQAPWYLSASGAPGLKHQRNFKGVGLSSTEKNWHERGIASSAARTFRKGACTNCGAMTHEAKFCVERPRKLGARWTGQDIKPDEFIREASLDYDGKRDRWNGYDASMHREVVEMHEEIEKERREIKKKQIEKTLLEGANSGSDSESKKKAKPKKVRGDKAEGESSSDEEVAPVAVPTGEEMLKEDMLEDESVAPFQRMDAKSRTTIRNLRIREDTAKYLRNLDVNSAYYDPKTRSMRENPLPNSDPNEQLYQGDNFVRQTGDFAKFAGLMSFEMEAYDKGTDVHMTAMPSQAEMAYKEFKVKKEELKKKQREEILSKYGAATQEEEKLPRELLLAQTEAYVEYSRDGKIIKGLAKAVPKSKYEEDVRINNHTSVWGSYWYKGKWGFACCHQLVKNAYCTGEAGKAAADAAADSIVASLKQAVNEEHERKAREEEEKTRRRKLAEAEREQCNDADDRRRPYNSSREIRDVTEEDMEEYRLKRIRSDDPMAAFFAEREHEQEAVPRERRK
eukprot:tig00000217_g19173.t1